MSDTELRINTETKKTQRGDVEMGIREALMLQDRLGDSGG